MISGCLQATREFNITVPPTTVVSGCVAVINCRRYVVNIVCACVVVKCKQSVICMCAVAPSITRIYYCGLIGYQLCLCRPGVCGM